MIIVFDLTKSYRVGEPHDGILHMHLFHQSSPDKGTWGKWENECIGMRGWKRGRLSLLKGGKSYFLGEQRRALNVLYIFFSSRIYVPDSVSVILAQTEKHTNKSKLFTHLH